MSIKLLNELRSLLCDIGQLVRILDVVVESVGDLPLGEFLHGEGVPVGPHSPTPQGRFAVGNPDVELGGGPGAVPYGAVLSQEEEGPGSSLLPQRRFAPQAP